MTNTTLSIVKQLPIAHCEHRNAHLHGTVRGYDYCGCRCEPCRLAANDYRRRYHNATGNKIPLVPADTARAHVGQLTKRGMPRWAIAEQIHMAENTLRAVQSGKVQQIIKLTEDAILTAVYDSNPAPHRHLVRIHGPQRRLQHLAVLGWSLAALEKHTGLNWTDLQKIRSGTRQAITKETAGKIEAATRALSTRKPPQATDKEKRAVERTIREARSKGWVTIYAWEDPDDVASSCESTVAW